DSRRAFSQDFSISPDEDRIAYSDSKNRQFDIWVMPVGGAPAQITDDPQEDTHPVWHPDGKRIIFSSNRGGAYQICVADLDRRATEQITLGENDCLASDVSSDGARILYNSVREESDLWRAERQTGRESEVTSDVGLEFWPDLSADGKTLLFQAGTGTARLTAGSIMIKPVAGDGPQLPIVSDAFDPKWSPDGHRIAFLRFTGDQFNLWTLDPNRPEPMELVSGLIPSSFRVLPITRTEVGGYSWSPEAASIAYCSSKSGAANIWTISANGGDASRWSVNTDPDVVCHRPLWSPSG